MSDHGCTELTCPHHGAENRRRRDEQRSVQVLRDEAFRDRYLTIEEFGSAAVFLTMSSNDHEAAVRRRIDRAEFIAAVEKVLDVQIVEQRLCGTCGHAPQAHRGGRCQGTVPARLTSMTPSTASVFYPCPCREYVRGERP